MSDFYVKKDDTLPAIRATLKDADDVAVDLTGCSVRFIMTSKSDEIGDTPKVDAAANIITAASGIVEYAWQTGDTDTAGKYRAEFEVEFPSGGYETFPNDSYIEVKVTGDLGGDV